MIEKYEILSVKLIEGKEETSFKEVPKKDATHKHICYHDEEHPRSCRRVKL